MNGGGWLQDVARRAGAKHLRRKASVWRARLGSNQQPLPSEGSTLSIELRAQREAAILAVRCW